jgi:nucleotide-binding universal stress UspA family protein
LDDLINDLNSTHPGLNIGSHLTFGGITDGLVEYAEKHKPWLIIVGNSLSEEDSFWFGGNLLQLMRELPFPVLAIPNGTDFRTVKNICFACDYKRVTDHLPAQELVNIVKTIGASLQVLNIDHDNKSFGTETPLESTSLHEMIGTANPTYHYIDNANIDEGIQNFINQNQADWLVVTPHRHTFFEGLFHKSRTKAIARNIHIPILALHEK